MSNLRKFRFDVSALMRSEHERPFVCSGSPFACSVFLVGFNPATRLKSSFWSFWSDSAGFNRLRFVEEYEQTKKVVGVRKRLNAMVSRFPAGSVLETNICSEPTKRAADLKLKDRRSEIFRFLLKSIRPRVVFLHSNEPIRYFKTLLDKPTQDLPHHKLVNASALGIPMTVCASEGPLFSKKVSGMESIADALVACTREAQIAC